MATTEQRPTAKLVAMADPFLLKPANNSIEQAARRSALVGYIRRVLEKHGPLESSLLMEAIADLGISKNTAAKARVEAGALGYKQDRVMLVALEHQVPEDATIIGRPRHQPEPLGVATGADEHPIGENNGEAPEPREEPVQGLVDDGWSAGVETQPPVIEPEPEPVAIPVLDSWLGGSLPPADPTAIPFQAIRDDGDVIAAAQLLIQSLGIKTVAPEVLTFIEHAEQNLEEAKLRISVTENFITRIRECLA